MIIAVLPPRNPYRLAPTRAPEQQADVLARSAVLLQAQRSHPPLACSPSKTLVVLVPADKFHPAGPGTPNSAPSATFKSP